MSQYCKFYKQKKQVSYDSGATWQDVAPAEYQKGDLYDPYSPDCGAIILERWVNNGTICSGATGFDKYYYQVKQESYDNGTTWATTTDYRLGELIEANSPDCLYNPPSFNGKWIGYYKYGNVFSQGCDENNRQPPIVDLSWENVDGDSPFNNSELLSAIVGDCVAQMWGSFYGCGSLVDVHIGSGVRHLYDRAGILGAFQDCYNLKRVNSNVDGVANIPSNVETIGFECFRSCYNLTTINIPNSVTEIGNGAFDGCRNLTGMVIPDSVTTIGLRAFSDCSGLTSVTIGSGLTEIDYYTFEDCVKLTGITIPDSVTTISGGAFRNCSGMTYVNIGSGVTKIGGEAFENCYNLSSVTIPDSVTEIGSSAFYQCTVLTSVTIGSGIITIGSSAFTNCYGISSITIGSGVTSIGQYAFSDCTGLTSVTVNAVTPPSLGYNAFVNAPISSIYVPSASVNAYRTATNWSRYADKIQAIP